MKLISICSAACMVASLVVSPAIQSDEVNVYSGRSEELIKPLLEQFTANTGIRVNLVTGKAGTLIKRIESEGPNSPADLLITVDAGRLHTAKAAGLLQAVERESIQSRVPSHLRDPDHQWVALSARARVMMYSAERVNPDQLSTYEALTDEQWRGRICIRSSGNIYNQSLLASMIANRGVAESENWAKGIVANMARKPEGNDRAQISAVAVGVCDVAIANTYYMGKMQTAPSDDPERTAAEKVKVFFPNQGDRGAHMNVSGAGVVSGSKNRDNAVRLLEFLLSDEAQKWYAEVNHEYPVVDGIAVSEVVASWGYPFSSDSLNVSLLGVHNAEAVRVFDRAGWR